MNKGLYAPLGESATCFAAARAILFDFPSTKVSKVKFSKREFSLSSKKGIFF